MRQEAELNVQEAKLRATGELCQLRNRPNQALELAWWDFRIDTNLGVSIPTISLLPSTFNNVLE